jgi:hypothetical protein
MGKWIWRKLAKKRLLKEIYKSPENLLEVLFRRTHRWSFFHFFDEIFLFNLNRYLFKLQYKAIIKPDCLEVLSDQALEAKR